ncbi:oligopeptide ABC transporter substrate-binding protein [uncultured Granulicatella sp.]|uniref:oligopeptide ABC transporter substrate-binding protein n=1 Tax=uncultured Granulicatella sp. TaxID=316089 RepID=UPI0026092913|nr:oligopeptide ABC transporter substrate-binding protein [uncultured Granulicatella sp.]
MNKKAIAGLLGAASLVTLAACNNNNKTSGDSSSNAKTEERKFASDVTNEGTVIKGGTINYAVVSASPFKGLINPLLYVDSGDGSLVDFAFASLFEFDANQRIKKDGGMMEFTLDKENKIVTLKLRSKDYKWSDGQPLTIDDYIFTYEFVGRKDYDGVRYDENAENIVGMKDFHEGKADKISGLEKVDDQTVKIHLEEVYPALEMGGNAILGQMLPKHVFKDMSYEDAVKSEKSRTNVVGNGPFVVDKVVPGESVTYKKNPYYYKGEPKVDGLKADVVSPDSIVQEMKAGKYDFASMPTDQYDTYKNLSNINLLGTITNYIAYVGFNMGHFDKDKGEHVFEPGKKMSDPALRKAIAYALDNDQVAKETYQGLRISANTLLSPFFGEIYADKSEVPGFTYNPEESKKILADAGYKDTDNDGYVEDKEGKPLTITLLVPAGSQTDDAVIQQYIEWWKNVGLRVELLNGRALEFNAYAEKLTKYADDFDMWLGAFTIGYNPDPDGLYGPKARFNFGHYVNDEHTKLISQIASSESFDAAKRVELFKQWQKFVFENPFQLPRFNSYSLQAVNKRVKHVDIAQGKETGWEQVELLSDTGVAEK